MTVAKTMVASAYHGTPLPLAAVQVPRIPVFLLGMSLGIFLAITYSLCVGFDLLFPGHAMYQT